MAKPAIRTKRKPIASPPPSVAPRPAASTLASRSTALRAVASIAALLFLVALSYSNSLQNGFTWDDHQQIEMNSGLRPGFPLAGLFFSDVWSFSAQSNVGSPRIYYRPLQMLTYRLIASSIGFSPWPFHLLSVVSASLAAVLSLLFFWMLTRRLAISFAAAALFAVHPIHTEAVDWAYALPDLSCTVFLLDAFSLFLQA
jgi:protein O-mannosyl-transferase